MKRGREAGGVGTDGGSEGKGRRVDLLGLKHISIHGEEEATDSRETGTRLRAEYHTHTYNHTRTDARM